MNCKQANFLWSEEPGTENRKDFYGILIMYVLFEKKYKLVNYSLIETRFNRYYIYIHVGFWIKN